MMLEDFDALAMKITQLAAMVQSLRVENQQLRGQLVTASADLDAMNSRVDEATHRLDAVLQRLPDSAKPGGSTQWKT